MRLFLMHRIIKVKIFNRTIKIPNEIEVNDNDEATLILPDIKIETISKEEGWKAAERLCNYGYATPDIEDSSDIDKVILHLLLL